jgi:hypothetical protein
MAIISIPTSIGGIGIPGSAVNGPLKNLFKNKYQTEAAYYPRDLGSATKGHVVSFDFYKQDSYGIEQAFKQAVTARESISSAIDQVKTINPAEKINEAWQSGIKSVKEIANDPVAYLTRDNSQIVNNIKPEYSKKLGTVNLYMPDTLDFTQGASYDDGVSLVSAAGALPGVGKVVGAINSVLGDNAAARLALNKGGYVFNPQQQLLFQGIDFREFSLSFTFTPFSKQEAEQVQKIIRMFRENAAPTAVKAAAGFFWEPPSAVDIKFMFNNGENLKINKVTRSVITSVEVNYAPNGWSAHNDGNPVQTTMTLGFKEIELLDRTKIQEMYGDAK